MSKSYNDLPLIDWIFPIVKISKPNDDLDAVNYEGLFGTAFLVGKQGFALTCAHVVKDYQDSCAGMFVVNGQWQASQVTNAECHPSEDVAILQLRNRDIEPVFIMPATPDYQFCDYFMAGYPEDVLYDRSMTTQGKGVSECPDMVAVKGSIRRRFTGQIVGFNGKSFFELNEIGGRGCSGSPIWRPNRGKWPLLGIYVGEKLIERTGSSKCPGCEKEVSVKVNLPTFGYAVRADAFADWKPEMLKGSSIREEAECKYGK